GSATAPITFGGGGAAPHQQYTAGGHGGGRIYINTSGNIAISGTVQANGTTAGNNYWGGGSGGAGGSVYLVAGGTLSGTGSIQANGAAGGICSGACGSPAIMPAGGGGGGGRIALIKSVNSYTGPLSVSGGVAGSANATAGTSGTIHNP
ncbi:MAG: hypothetical protein K2X47_12115, partial [Bdellovibrionales bacterium]|nr:hypothetical protein [Bdellovibrionales bacterium]